METELLVVKHYLASYHKMETASVSLVLRLVCNFFLL